MQQPGPINVGGTNAPQQVIQVPGLMYNQLTPYIIKFSGEGESVDFMKFKRTLEESNAMTTLQEGQRKMIFFRCLEGIAQQFYMDQTDVHTKTYDEICELFEKEFEKKKVTTLVRLQQIIQLPKERTKDYYARFMREAQPAADDAEGDNNLTAIERNVRRNARKEAISQIVFPIFIQGLRSELRETVIRERVETIEAAKELARNHEQYIENYGPMIRELHHVSFIDDQDVNQVTYGKPDLTQGSLHEGRQENRGSTALPVHEQA
jgi:hypothetical protein